MPTPLVSIIIPTYNRGHLIGETLDSILAQTNTNWECIVVDDGSTDNTATLLAEYCKKDQRFQYHHRPINRPKGANACRNNGFEISKGEYINWFDSDDVMLPEKLEVQLGELHNSSFDYTICQTMMFDVATNKELGLRAPKLKSDTIFEDYILGNIFWLTGAPLWKRDFLKCNKLRFDERLQQAQDYDFHMRVLAISQNYFYNENIFVHFLIHDLSMSKSMVDTEEKIYSNAKVLSTIILKFEKYLNNKTVLDTFKKLISFYREALRQHHIKTAFIILSNIFRILILKKGIVNNRIEILFKCILGLIFPTFGIGFKLTKLDFKISNE